MCASAGAPPRLRWNSRPRGGHVLHSSLPPIWLCSSGTSSVRPITSTCSSSPTSLVKHLTNRGAPKQRISYVASTAASQKGFECLSASLSIELLWVPSWGNPADAPSRGTSLACWKRSLPKRPRQAPTLQFGSAAVARELKLLREPLSSAAGKRRPAAV